jgi:tRNA-splicing ligase RtcB (3'-phosphate/5'-hydroxy nucleic acid ligase)
MTPQAYRRLPEVLACHEGTVTIEHTLRPFAVVIAGAADRYRWSAPHAAIFSF